MSSPVENSSGEQLLIEVNEVSKRFRLQREHQRSMQDAFIRLFGRRRSGEEYFWPLRNVSMEVRPGDSYGILGQNGSGKSTLLKLITGVLEPTHGTIRLNGRIASLLELGAGFHPDLSGRENIFLNGSVYGLNRRDMARKLDMIIDFAELGDFIDTPVRHYSSGMYVRLGFSVAIHTDPDVLIVDEVLTVGDQIFQQKCMDRIWELKRDGVAIVLVSHNLEEIRRLCDQAIWLQNGIARAAGSSLEIVDDYLAYTNELYYAHRKAEQADSVQVTKDGEQSSHRWGTHRAEIVKVEILDGSGQVADQFNTGDPLCIRMHYATHERIIKPTFGLAIYRNDGVHVNGPNSVAEGFHIEYLEGKGYIDYRVKALLLNPGRYELTVAIYNRNSTIAIDHHHRMYDFELKTPRGQSEAGIVHLPATWHHVKSPALVASPER